MTADRYESLDEFDLLREDAAEFGLSWDGPPAVTRLSVAAGGGAVRACGQDRQATNFRIGPSALDGWESHALRRWCEPGVPGYGLMGRDRPGTGPGSGFAVAGRRPLMMTARQRRHGSGAVRARGTAA